jgi:hypothetical protein
MTGIRATIPATPDIGMVDMAGLPPPAVAEAAAKVEAWLAEVEREQRANGSPAVTLPVLSAEDRFRTFAGRPDKPVKHDRIEQPAPAAVPRYGKLRG